MNKTLCLLILVISLGTIEAQVSKEESEKILQKYKQRNADRKDRASTQPKTTTRKATTQPKSSCKHCSGNMEIPCKLCRATGLQKCDSCKSRGKVQCTTCQGKYLVVCSYCRGKGKTRSGSRTGMGGMVYPTYSRCYSCRGSGRRSNCSYCVKGFSTCTECGGKRKTACETCWGNKMIKCLHCPKLPNKNVNAKVNTVNVNKIIVYAISRAKIAAKAETDIRKSKINTDTQTKIKSMLAEGPLTLTYKIINAEKNDNGNIILSVGPSVEMVTIIENLYKSNQIRKCSYSYLYYYTNYSFILSMSNEQALSISKNSKFIVKGNVGLFEDQYDVLKIGPYKIRITGSDSYLNLPVFYMKTFSANIDGKKVRFVGQY